MRNLLLLVVPVLLFSCKENPQQNNSSTDLNISLSGEEKHRPQFHFSPDSMWMNDPNGMVYHQGTYHLFYQYYPDSTIWGPMHWGHATSKDLIHWEHKPIALYPDKHGYIFSGSAIVDMNNTSGFGTIENPPLVAIFTYHDSVGQHQNRNDFETQGIAYSLDNGESWKKYEGNPVLMNPGIRDFRDPKVRWSDQSEMWIMTLAVKDHIEFYSSPDLKSWKLESAFGKELGAHGGVWECPDLFPMQLEGSDKELWILFVSINPGGPNGGSSTQYFIGDFDGTTFTPIDSKIRWIDYGPDNYAGVTWSNTGDRTLFLGWMSNWKYAQVVPTETWRSATTLPRELHLLKSGGELALTSYPVKELNKLMINGSQGQDLMIEDSLSLTEKFDLNYPTFDLNMSLSAEKDFDICIYNEIGEKLIVSFSSEDQVFSIDRSHLEIKEFHPDFNTVLKAPRFSKSDMMDLRMVVDVASIELFADGGSTVMTCIYFPEQVLDQVQIVSSGKLVVERFHFRQLESIW